jgi:hypothetical protein
MSIQTWLENHGLGSYADRFQGNGVGRSDLAGLRVEDLADDLGVIDLQDRLRLLEAAGAAPAPLTESLQDWLTRVGLEAHAPAFREAGVTEATLVLLTASDLRDRLGVVRLSDRRRALSALERIRRTGQDPLAGILSGVVALEELPFPIAHPLAFALSPDASPSDRLDNLVFAALQTVRLTTLLLLADYLASDEGSPNVDAYVYRALRQPSWADWSDLCSRLTSFWRKGGTARASRFPRLVAGWREIGSLKGGRQPGWEALLEGLPGLGDRPARNANEALWRARNDLAHRRATRSARSHDDAARLARLAPVLVEALAKLFGPGSPTLLRRVGEGSAIVLHGAHADLKFLVEPCPEGCQDAFADSEVVARTPTGSLAVHPLVAPLTMDGEGAEGPTCLVDGMTGRVDLGLVDGVTEQSAILMGVQRFVDSPELGDALRRALERKGVALRVGDRRLDPHMIAHLATSASRDQLAVLRGRKYFPDCYVERRRLDSTLREQLGRPGEALLLLGEAGTGKSSLLARLVEEQVGGDPGSEERPALPTQGEGGPEIVVYLQGRTAFPSDAAAPGARLLCEAVCRQAGIQRSKLQTLLDLFTALDERGMRAAPGARLLLVIDALNEADRFRDLARALDDALPCVVRFPWLRLIVSVRTGAYEALKREHAELQRHGADPFANGRFWRRFEVSKDKEPQGHLEVRPFRAREVEEAYVARQQSAPSRSCQAIFAELPPDVRTLLATPLQLHLFHETYHGRVVPSSLDSGRLLRDHLDRMVTEQPGLGATLAELGRELLDRRRPDVPRELADALLARWRAGLGSMRERAIRLDPLEELEAASILVRPRNEGEGAAAYTFCHERLAEQVILAEVQRRADREGGLTGASLLRWTRDAVGEDGEPFPLLLEALGELWADRARAGDGESLRSLTRVESASARAQLLSEALCALAPLWGRSEEGAAGPRAVLDVLFALPDADAAERLAEGTWRAQQRMSRIGARPYALAISRRRIGLLEAAHAAGPQDSETQRDLAVSLASCAFLVTSGGNGREGRALLDRACVLLAALEGSAVEVRGELAYVQSQLSRSAERRDGAVAALPYAAEACRLREALYQEDQDNPYVRRVLAFVLNQRASYLVQVADSRGTNQEQARAAYLRAADLLRNTERTATGNATRVFAFSLSKIAGLARQDGDLVLARNCAEEAATETARMVRAQPSNVHAQRSLGFARQEVARIAREEGDHAAARGLLEDVLKIRRRLVDRDPTNSDFQGDLGFALFNLGEFDAKEGDVRRARDRLLQSASLRQARARSEPQRRDLARDVAKSLQELAKLSESLSEARGHLREARAALAPFLSGIDSSEDVAALDRTLLRDLEAAREGS